MALTIEKCTEVVKLYNESYSPVTVIRSMQNDISSLLAFANWMKDRPDMANNALFTDKAHFY